MCFAIAVGVTGCSSPPEAVYVDLSSVSLFSSQPVEVPELDATGERVKANIELPELAQRDLYIGSAEEKAKEALEVFRVEQERAIAGVMDRLEKAYTAEVALSQREAALKIEGDYQTWVDDALLALRSKFEDHARVVGELRIKLTALVGFPDPDPKSVRVPPQHDKPATERFDKARALRLEIDERDAAFKSLIKDRLAVIEARRTQMLDDLAKSSEADRQAAISRAREEARAVAQQALAMLERTALAPETQLPAVPGASSSVDSRPTAPEPIAKGKPDKESPESLRELLDVFLKVMNYRLVDDPMNGRDATAEFLEWRQKFAHGR